MGQSNECLRCREDCFPLQNILADEGVEDGKPASFICVGYNTPDSRVVAGDRFTLCWKNNAVDERGHWDRRDMLDTMSVIATALSTDENIRVGNGFSEDEMNTTNFKA